MTDHTYNPLERRTFEAIAYNAVGRASEINTYPSYELVHSTGNSGWSVGAVQWDFGQPGRGAKVGELLAGYQSWAPADQRFTDEQVASLTTRLQTRGQTGNELSTEERTRLGAYLRSDPGREFVGGLNEEQIQKKWDNVGQPRSQVPWLQTLAATDPAQAAEIVAMTSKLYNQNETRGAQLIERLQDGAQTSEQVGTWIGSDGIEGLNKRAQTAIVSGRDGALAGVRLMNDLELGTGRLSEAWREQIHTNGNVSLTRDFNNNPDVQLLDAMMRNPAAGARIFEHVDEGAPARAVAISGINASARLEMSRVARDKDGNLTVESPQGDTFQKTAEGWNKNGVPMQGDTRRQPDMPDHMGGGSWPRAASETQPEAHPIHRQSQEAVRRLDESLGLPQSYASDCLSASVACLAKSSGLERVDHVYLSGKTATAAAGERVFAVEGDPGNPTHRSAHMSTREAISTPIAESLQRLDQIEREQARSMSQVAAVQQDVPSQESVRRGPMV